MPHLTLEYSKNLESKIDSHALISALHQSLNSCAEIDMNRLKSRAFCTSDVISGGKGHLIQMLHVTLAVLSGRPEEVRKGFGQRLYDALTECVDNSIGACSLTVEVREMDRNSYFRN